MKTTVVGIREAKAQFSKLVKRAAEGEESVAARSGRPVAKIVAYSPASAPRKPGLLAGKITFKPGFDALPPGFEEAFGS